MRKLVPFLQKLWRALEPAAPQYVIFITGLLRLEGGLRPEWLSYLTLDGDLTHCRSNQINQIGCESAKTLLNCCLCLTLCEWVRNYHGYEMCALRQGAVVRQCDQPREQYPPPSLESESSTRSRRGCRRSQTNPCVHLLHSVRPSHESSLAGVLPHRKNYSGGLHVSQEAFSVKRGPHPV